MAKFHIRVLHIGNPQSVVPWSFNHFSHVLISPGRDLIGQLADTPFDYEMSGPPYEL